MHKLRNELCKFISSTLRSLELAGSWLSVCHHASRLQRRSTFFFPGGKKCGKRSFLKAWTHLLGWPCWNLRLPALEGHERPPAGGVRSPTLRSTPASGGTVSAKSPAAKKLVSFLESFGYRHFFPSHCAELFLSVTPISFTATSFCSWCRKAPFLSLLQLFLRVVCREAEHLVPIKERHCHRLVLWINPMLRMGVRMPSHT